MIKTKIKKAAAIASIATLATATIGTTLAADIGTATVSGDATFDATVVWDDAFPGYATGSVSGIVVKAEVEPTLNMTLSASEIDLGTLISGVTSNGTLDIEVGTNAANGVTITARSGSGGLTNLSDTDIQINNTGTDGVTESYTFASTDATTHDSSYAAFSSDGDLTTTEVNDNTTEHVVYNTNNPEAEDSAGEYDVTFTVSATSAAETAAGEYEDTITFTVTGNF